MHLNYYFLRQLSAALHQRLTGREVVECFSQEKDELILGFTDGRKEFYLQAILTSRFTALAFPESFNRARANSVTLFPEIIGSTVQAVVQHENERSFAVELSGEWVLLFKMFGNRSNIILFHHQEPVALFHQKLRQDLLLRPDQMGKTLPLTYESFVAADSNLRRFLPTLGEVPLRYLAEEGYENKSFELKWELVQDLLSRLQAPSFFLVNLEGQLRLSLLPVGQIEETFSDPIEASRSFVNTFLREYQFQTTFKRVHQHLQKAKEGARHLQAQAWQKLQELQQDFSFSQTADLIMANLTNILPQAEEVEVYDFYQDQTRTIKLKTSETPQKYAERLYKKAKNRQIELKRLEERMFQKEEQLQETEKALAELESIGDFRELKAFLKKYPVLLAKKTTEKEQLFREFDLQGFKILVGKNAKNNDLLTQRHAHKEDLWLHAKDVAGSHVVVKHQTGKPFPESVVEAAAELAAYYSKRKSDTLCPVTYTPKKYVRKPKGAEPGAVVVEREKVLLVPPRNPFQQEP